MSGLRLKLLGGFELRPASGEPIPLSARKPALLLAYLALRQGQPLGRDRLAGLFWGDSGEAQARASLRQALAVLRRRLGPHEGLIQAPEGETVALARDGLATDVAEFERCLAAGGRGALERAAALYEGDLLDGFQAPRQPLLEEWLVAERQRLRERALAAMAALLPDVVAADPPEAGVRLALRILALDPLQEVAHRALMRLHARQGRRGAALARYQMLREALARELGCLPRRRHSSSTGSFVTGAAARARTAPLARRPPPEQGAPLSMPQRWRSPCRQPRRPRGRPAHRPTAAAHDPRLRPLGRRRARVAAGPRGDARPARPVPAGRGRRDLAPRRLRRTTRRARAWSPGSAGRRRRGRGRAGGPGRARGRAAVGRLKGPDGGRWRPGSASRPAGRGRRPAAAGSAVRGPSSGRPGPGHRPAGPGPTRNSPALGGAPAASSAACSSSRRWDRGGSGSWPERWCRRGGRGPRAGRRSNACGRLPPICAGRESGNVNSP